MKVYFACSVRGGGDTSNYLTILDAIKACGAEVISEIFVHDAINFSGSPLPDKQIYKRDTAMITECDVVVAEVTNPSLGVGYELAYAEKLKKPVPCLFDSSSGKNLSAMVAGNDYFHTKSYSNKPEIVDAIAELIAS